MKKLLTLGMFVLVFWSKFCLSDVVFTNTSSITRVWTWAQTGSPVDGDAIIHLSTGLAECPSGVFLQEAERSDKAFSAALTAYTANKSIRVQVYNDQFWSGSSVKYCKVRAIFLE